VRFELRQGVSASGEATVALLPRGAVAQRLADEPRVVLDGHVPKNGSTQAGLGPVAFTPEAGGATADRVTLGLPGRDVLTTQNIWGRVSLARNTRLLAGTATAGAFVYTVPDARMPAPATPLLSSVGPVDLTPVSFAPSGPEPGPDERRPLVDWLVNFFDSLLNRVAVGPDDTLAKIADRHGIGLAELAPAVADVAGLFAADTTLALPGGPVPAGSSTLRQLATDRSLPLADVVAAAAAPEVALTPGTLLRPVANERRLGVGVDYAFALATATAPDPAAQQTILSRLPVFLRPAFLFDSATDLAADSGFCADLARQLTAWATRRGVPDDTGMWVLGVSLFTTLPSDATAVPDTTPPLLQLRDVRLRRDRVAPTADERARPTTEDTP
jgi:hypothetical protein